MPDLVGTTLQDRYVVGDPAARGPRATIFRATVLDTGDTVALKAFDALARQSAPFIAAFRGLSRQALEINSPYIVPLLAYGQSAGTYYQVTEWTDDAVPSQPRLHGPVNVARAVRLVSEAAAGLAALHAGNLIHGHLKLSNVRRRLGGSAAIAGGGEPLLVNIEQLAQGDPSHSAAYLSPEQILSQPLSAGTDLYALGVILYQLATGRVPFSGPDAAATLRSHLEQAAVSPREVNPEIEPRLDDIIGRLLVREPAGRLSSAQELRDELVALRPLYPEVPAAGLSLRSAGEAEARRGWMARLFRTRQDPSTRGLGADGTELSVPSLLD